MSDDDDRTPASGLITQAEARRTAKVVGGIARPYPLGCWGGTELGWTVELPGGGLLFPPVLPVTAS